MIINMTSGGVMPSRIIDEQVIIPGKENVMFEEGTYLRGSLTILGDPDLDEENIKDGINIFGKQGTPGGFGKCVWQRGNYTPSRSEDIYFQYVDDDTVKLNKAGIPLSSLIGMNIEQAGTYMYIKIHSATQLAKYQGGSLKELYEFTYDESTGVLSADLPYLNGFTSSGEHPSKTLYYSEIFDVLTHAVHDNPSKYPDNGWHTDGLYYRLLAAVSSANVASLSDYTVAAVQQDYRDTIEEEVSNA